MLGVLRRMLAADRGAGFREAALDDLEHGRGLSQAHAGRIHAGDLGLRHQFDRLDQLSLQILIETAIEEGANVTGVLQEVRTQAEQVPRRRKELGITRGRFVALNRLRRIRGLNEQHIHLDNSLPMR